ncbi:unnamed protein product [Paramecium primaurelia]|uniref:Uncharacterized protein n=1 Tax=Paramecium primaurelia TaxID=5886 RepID=A0A8S1LK15_PARPR|nr:unnamed protein product [Paramecium primaurelia]
MLMKILKNKERRFRKRLEYINAYKRRSILYFYQVMDSIIDSLTVQYILEELIESFRRIKLQFLNKKLLIFSPC